MKRSWAEVFKPLSSNRGQGVIEYILVLIVTVSIILGFIYQFNDAFRVYAKSYFGDYLACLLETGELPAIGGEGTGICSAVFQEFSLAKGKPLIGKGIGEGGSDSSGPSSKGASSTAASESKASGSTRYVAKNTGSSGGGFGSRSSSKSGGEFADSSKKRAKDYTGSSAISIPPSTLGNGARGSTQDRYLDGDFYVEKRKVEEREESNKITIKSSTASVKDAQRMRVNRQVAKIQDEKPDSEFTIGNILRVLLIIAIIIALIVFLGGQALQISKSMD